MSFKNSKLDLFSSQVWVGIVLVNIITGLMVDTFSSIREDEQWRRKCLANECFVCGVQRHAYEDYGLSSQVRLKLDFLSTRLSYLVSRKYVSVFLLSFSLSLSKDSSFEEHLEMDHNLWMYIYYIAYLRKKDPTAESGIESFVRQQVSSQWTNGVFGC